MEITYTPYSSLTAAKEAIKVRVTLRRALNWQTCPQLDTMSKPKSRKRSACT
jgi:hypothetical protein